jgi:general stress protein 26
MYEDSLEIPLGADIRRVRELTRGCDVAFLVTAGGNEEAERELRARPMLHHGIDDDGCTWFFTEGHAGKVRAVANDGRVGLAWSDPLRGRWVVADGWADVVQDRARMGRLWTDADAAWFPEGLASPDLVLLRVALAHVSYWETEAGPIERIAWNVRRMLGRAGKPPETAHGRLDLRNQAPFPESSPDTVAAGRRGGRGRSRPDLEPAEAASQDEARRRKRRKG